MYPLTNLGVGYISLSAFIIAYTLVIFEEKINLKKSKPVVLIGCFMWFVIGIYESNHGNSEHTREYIKHLIAEIGELFFFLLVALTYINTIEEEDIIHGKQQLQVMI